MLGVDFHNRTAELVQLERFASELRSGTTRWLAIIGPRKVGKTSMILELSRRTTGIDFVVADAQESASRPAEVFRMVALRTADALLAGDLENSLEVLAAAGRDVDDVLDASAVFGTLPARVRTAIRSVTRADMNDEVLRLCLDLPERMAEALDRKILIAVDEFQELAVGDGKNLLSIVRSTWQHHRRVGYVVSGSGRSMLEDMVTREHSPFFQHFALMYVEPFKRSDAIALLAAGGTGRAIPLDVAERAVDVLGGHPFYLQLLGETLTATEPPYDDAALKDAFQSLLFSRSGRLSLYLQLGFDRAVGRSTYLAAVLDALGDGPLRMTDIARRVHTSTADAARYLERLGDLVRRHDDGTYVLDDPVFGLWLRWRRPGGAVVPMSVIGDAAERDVAGQLARMGFDLVYQSRASRGAFDLLATRGALQLGVQVKRSPLPLTFGRVAWTRMTADAERLGWRWVIAAVDREGAIQFLDPAKATRGKSARVAKGAAIENLAAWLDRKSGAHPRSARKGAGR